MQYMGGKSRIAKPISEYINSIIGDRPFVSLFCGSCAIESKVNAKIKICNDKHKYLIAMWRALQNGYKPPNTISEEQYKYIKEHKDENPALSGFVGFGCSFGGKWFGGYGRSKNRNHCAESKRSVLKDLNGLKSAKFTNLDYKEVIIPNNALIYCDPPYAKAIGYSKYGFDSNNFWNYVRLLSKNHTVIVSEQEAPSDFAVLWEKSILRTLDVNKENKIIKTEKLFTLRKEIE